MALFVKINTLFSGPINIHLFSAVFSSFISLTSVATEEMAITK